VGAIQVEPGSMNAAGKQSSRKGLLLAGVDHPQAVGIGGYVGPQVTRAVVGAFNFLEDEIFQLAGGYFVTIAQTVTNGARDGIGRVEVQAALDEVVGDHAAQKALPTAVGRHHDQLFTPPRRAVRSIVGFAGHD
ncbi:MAG: hypothetical protein WBO74_03085, partial [Thermoanaerobaculia bacterium]